MHKFLTIIASILLISLAGCYKDKGNYEYTAVEEPRITNLDTVYEVFVGDTLKVKPNVAYSKLASLSYKWQIAVPALASDLTFTGPEIRALFGLEAKRYTAKLTITDSSNGMKYFYTFIVSGQTAFSKGTAVLSVENGETRLSFIKPDGTVQQNVYEIANNGAKLGANPVQLVGIRHNYIVPYATTSYWVFTGGGDRGLQINSNTMKKIKTLKANFFTEPDAVDPGLFINSLSGVLQGVVNGQLYVGTSSTWNEYPLYGMFSSPAVGDYSLFKQAAFNTVMPYFLGYEKNRKQLVGFTNFGSAAYIGTGYQVVGTAFDPKNLGLDLLYFAQVNDGNVFALGKDASGTLKEIKLTPAFKGFIEISPVYIRPFAQPALITANTKWAWSPAEIFYFSSGSKIYRYNPLNEDFKQLTTDFGGKEVTMVKIADGGNTLLAGTEGTFYTLDVSTGKYGDIIKKQTGIPGQTIDVVSRND